MSITSSPSEQTSGSTPDASASQTLVHLDVGGRTFKLLRRTVQNYPESLIAKVINECPRSGQRSQPVYVDRNPKTFAWILEIYRGGDCEGTMPSMSAEHLQRDLDFYQLPSLDELGLPVVCRDVSSSRISADSASKKLMQEVVGEIIESGLEDTFPWCVYIYYRFSTATLAPRRRILVIPDAVRTTFLDPNLSFVKDRRHDAFVQAVHGKTFSVSPSTKDVAVRSPDTKTQFALQIPSEDLRKLVGTVAQSSGFYMDFKQRVNSPAANQPFSELPYIHLYPR